MPAKGARQVSIEAPPAEERVRDPAIALTAVTKTYSAKRGAVTALRELTLEAHAGERLGIVGPSGCGKSTLLELICGLEEPSAGTVAADGHAQGAERLRRCALMPQRDLLLPWRSALDNAALALELQGVRRAEARMRIRPLFARFGLDEFVAARPEELSGGMRQRVSFDR